MLHAASALLRDWIIVGRAVGVEGGGKERRYERHDGHQRAALRALVCGSHGDDDVVLVPHVEGIWVGVAEDGRHVQRADSFHLAVFCQVLIDRAQQIVCGWMKEEGCERSNLSPPSTSQSLVPFNLSLLHFCFISMGNYLLEKKMCSVFSSFFTRKLQRDIRYGDIIIYIKIILLGA